MELLRPGLAQTITLLATPGSTGAFQVSGSISAVQPDPTMPDNTSTAATTVAMLSDIAVSSTGTSSAQVGAAVSYTVTVSNAGPNPASAAQLTYTLGAGLTPGTATSTKGTCTTAGSVITCNLGDLSKTDVATITINGTAATAGAQTSTASVSSGSVETAAANNAASSATTVTAPPLPPSPPPSGGGNSGGGGGGGALSLNTVLMLALLAFAQEARRRRQRFTQSRI